MDIIKFAKLKKMAGGSSGGGSSGGGGSSSLFVKFLGDEFTEITENDLKGATHLKRYTFAYNTNLTKLTIPESVESGGEFMLEGANNCTELVLKATQLNSSAFRNSYLQRATLYSKALTNQHFYGCSYLEEVEIKDTVEKISGAYFYSCPKLKHLHLPDSVVTIGSVVQDCKALESINIPVNAVLTDRSAICYRCTGLKDIYFDARDAGNQSSPRGSDCPMFSDYKSNNALTVMTTLHIGKTVQRIPDYWFVGNHYYSSSSDYYSYISDVVFDEDTECTSIGNYAFKSNQKLTKIKFPKSLQQFVSHSFYGCNNLEIIELQSETPPILGSGAIQGSNSTALPNLTKIIVPKGKLEVYKSATGWSASKFADIMEEKIDGTEWNEVVE